MLRYKVDWLAFSLSILADNTSGRDDKLMECLGMTWLISMKSLGVGFTILEQRFGTM